MKVAAMSESRLATPIHAGYNCVACHLNVWGADAGIGDRACKVAHCPENRIFFVHDAIIQTFHHEAADGFENLRRGRNAQCAFDAVHETLELADDAALEVAPKSSDTALCTVSDTFTDAAPVNLLRFVACAGKPTDNGVFDVSAMRYPQ